MSHEEGGFTSEGFASFPNVYEDNKRIGACSEFNQDQLVNKSQEYAEFLRRTDLMPRARLTGDRVLNHLIFELAYRDNALDQRKQEDEICGNL